MVDTFLSQVQELAVDLGRRLDTERAESQVRQWAKRWGAEPDRVIVGAFARLREPGAVREAWPRFHEVAAAFEAARAAERRTVPQRPGVIPRNEVCEIRPGRLAACVEYARRNRDTMSRADIEAGIMVILSPRVTDEDARKYLRGTEGALRP